MEAPPKMVPPGEVINFFIVCSTAHLTGQSERLETWTTKFSQLLLNDSVTLPPNDLQQSLSNSKRHPNLDPPTFLGWCLRFTRIPNYCCLAPRFFLF